jgi:hypothetical protein
MGKMTVYSHVQWLIVLQQIFPILQHSRHSSMHDGMHHLYHYIMKNWEKVFPNYLLRIKTGFTWLFFALIRVTAFLMLFRGNEYFVRKNIKTLNK